MNPQAWLEAAFGSTARVRILRVLARAPDATFTERELARAARMSPNAVNRAVRALTGVGIVTVSRAGAAHVVRMSADVQLRLALRGIFALEARAWEDTLRTVERALPPDATAIVFGSAARGDASSKSDVDLLVVAKDREAALDAAAVIEARARARFPTTFDILLMDSAQARARAKRPGPVRSALEHGIRLGARLAEVEL